MLGGGGHVRRCSVGSIIEASPCVRAKGVVRKRKCTVAAPPVVVNPSNNPYDSGSELENARGYAAPYNRNSLAHEFEAAEINHCQLSFDSSAAAVQDHGHGYDQDNDFDFEYDYALGSARVTSAV